VSVFSQSAYLQRLRVGYNAPADVQLLTFDKFAGMHQLFAGWRTYRTNLKYPWL
jgi:hypothetical protein